MRQTTPSDRLLSILRDVRERASARRALRSLADLRSETPHDPARRLRFLAALRGTRGGFALIAECKRRSPSAGVLDALTPLPERAAAYARGGADALSILTEADHFGGALADLAALSAAGLPRLRKDFLLDEGMVLESIPAGADAVLLIAECLPGAQLRELRVLAGERGLAVLVEAHDAEQLERAIAAEPDCVGVNARDLRSFTTDLGLAEDLLRRIPEQFVRVAESGIHVVDDLRRLRAAGADAALIGTALMQAADPAALLRGWRTFLGPPRIKVCGITSAADARAAIAAGADALGVVFAPSPRQVDGACAREIVAAAAPVPVAGVFVDATRAEVEERVRAAGISAAQLCGREDPAEFIRMTIPVWRRLPVQEPQASAELNAWRSIASLFVLDHPSAPGGTGRTVDQDLARVLAAGAPCLLSGGLDGANAGAAAAAVRPYGLDASSRLESAPGVKDPQRVRDFVNAARHALI